MDRWRKLGERVVYKRFRTILSRTFVLPVGETEDFEVVQLRDNVVVVALTPSDEVVLVREFRPGPEDVLLEVPGGVVDAGRTPLEVAESELREETGYRGELTAAGTMLMDAYATNLKHVFVARDCERVADPEEPGLTEPVLVSLTDFREHLRGGRLTNVDAGYRALDFLGLL